MVRKSLFFLSISLLFAASLQAAPLEKPYDHGLWDSFLKKFVNEKGEVNYSAIKKDPELLNRYLEQLQSVHQSDFPEWPREEVIALLINAYHASAISTIVKKYPVKSIQEITGVWDSAVVSLHETSFSLNNLRANYLMGNYKDEKINFAISCMAKDCPVLSRDAYSGPKLDGQLFMAARRFVNDPDKVDITLGAKKINLSKLFKWYAADFSFNFGSPEKDMRFTKEEFNALSFISFYLEDMDKLVFLEEKKYKIKFKKFNWSLNDWVAV